jgi:YbbR domain-containing protein
MVRLLGLFENLGLKVAALIIAIGAWWYVQSGQTVDATITANLDWKLPPELLAAEPLPSTVTIMVTGTRAATRRAHLDQTPIPVDLTRARAGQMTVDFSALDVKPLLAGVKISGFFPADAKISLDQAMTRKVKVKPSLMGEPAEGYSVASIDIDPAAVEVRGPKRLLGQIYEARTAPIDVTEVAGDIRRPVQLDLPWGIQATSDTEPTVQIDVSADLQTRVFKDVPVVVASHPELQTPSRLTVTLQGPASALNGIAEDEVLGVVHLPAEVARTGYRAVYGPTTGIRLSVAHPLGGTARVAAVDPPYVEVSRR